MVQIWKTFPVVSVAVVALFVPGGRIYLVWISWVFLPLLSGNSFTPEEKIRVEEHALHVKECLVYFQDIASKADMEQV